MELKKLIDCSVNITGREVWADRTSVYDKYINMGNGAWIVRYNLRGNNKGMDTNRLVYEMMIIAGHDVLDCCDAVFGGEYTAAELSGTAGYLSEFLGDAKNGWEQYASVCINTGDYQCEFPVRDMFKMMTEWEGVCGITAKQAYRFSVEGQEKPKYVELKPYKRSRVYSQKHVSVASEERRIAAKFAVLGQMCQSLTSEGMKKAMSLLTAVKSAEKLYDYATAEMAEKVMCRWHWDVYGTQNNMHTIQFSAKDFHYAPECWKVVDEDYVKELLARWKEFVSAHPAPEWIKKDSMVQFKNQEITPKKWQGKLKVCRVYCSMDECLKCINWYAEVCTTKGKWDSLERNVDALELFSEQDPAEKPARKSQKAGNNPKPTIPNSETKAAPSVADLLLQVLAA